MSRHERRYSASDLLHAFDLGREHGRAEVRTSRALDDTEEAMAAADMGFARGARDRLVLSRASNRTRTMLATTGAVSHPPSHTPAPVVAGSTEAA